MLLTIEGHPALVDKQETTMTTRTRLTALALTAAALTMTTLVVDGTASAAALSRDFHSFGNRFAANHVVSHVAAFRAAPSQGTKAKPLPVTTTCGLSNCSPAPAPVPHKPPSPPTGDLGGDNGQPINGGGAGGQDGHACQGDRDCGIFRQD